MYPCYEGATRKPRKARLENKGPLFWDEVGAEKYTEFAEAAIQKDLGCYAALGF